MSIFLKSKNPSALYYKGKRIKFLYKGAVLVWQEPSNDSEGDTPTAPGETVSPATTGTLLT